MIKSADATALKAFPAFWRRIKCPRHYALIPGKEPFVMEENPALKNVSWSLAKEFKIKKLRPKRDKNGNKIQDFRNYYQPEISAAFAIEHIYDPLHPICTQCNRRCFRGLGNVDVNSIKRLTKD